MPKIIKAGKKEFIGKCRQCGCEFSYTLEELEEQYPFNSVPCPECGYRCYHPDQSGGSNETIEDYVSKIAIQDSLKVFKQFDGTKVGSE